MGSQGRTVGPQGQSRRLLPTPSGHPGLGGGCSAAGLRAMTSALVWCSVQSPLVGVAPDTPSPERNKTRRGPGAPSCRFRQRSCPRRAASCQVSAPRSRASPAPRAPPARPGPPAAPARCPRPARPPPGALRRAGRKVARPGCLPGPWEWDERPLLARAALPFPGGSGCLPARGALAQTAPACA